MKGFAMIMLCLIMISCQYFDVQKKDFEKLKSPYIQNTVENFDWNSKEEKEALNAVDLTKYLPEDFVKNASKDYTEYIQKGLNENKIVKMPNFALLINEAGLIVKSGSRIIFQKKSSLVMKPNSLTHYGVIKISNVNDVIIYSPEIIGERDEHKGNEGEWGMGIFILGATNVQVIRPNIINCWGDGIYIGRGEKGGCRNVKIINAVIDNCRRNGISITDGENIEIKNPIISNTNGTLPMCGIDIEPNDNKATIDNIQVINPKTFNNSNAGILIYLYNLVGNVKRNVNIKIENHIDNNSDIGFELGGYNEENKTAKALSGSIEIINPAWKNNRRPISAGNNGMGPKANFYNINIKNSEENIEKIKYNLSKRINIAVK
jgi:hypothetical protein